MKIQVQCGAEIV